MTGADPRASQPRGNNPVPGQRSAAGAPVPAETPLSEAVADFAAAEDGSAVEQERLLARITTQTAHAWRNIWRPRDAVRWLTDQVTDAAPHIAIRNLETLRRHHDGLDGDALADRLVRNAGRAAAGVGMAGGGLAAVEWVATPTLLTAPVLLTAETLAVVAIELKLIGELHEVYRQPVPGNGSERAVALLQAWAGRRGVSAFVPGQGVGAVLGTAARKELRERLVRRYGRSITSLGPMLTGAAVAGFLNNRATLALGEQVRRDLTAAPGRHRG